jgi:hypothetical protein
VKYEGLNAILREFLTRSHPVGEIYMTQDADFDPNVTFGGTWQKLPDGVFVRNAGGNAGTVGDVQQEELPNITGSLDNSGGTFGLFQVAAAPNPTGAFQCSDEKGSTKWGEENPGTAPKGLTFDAHESNAIYKDGGHVTPVNVAVYMWKRTA